MKVQYYNSRKELGCYVMSYFGHQTLLFEILDLGRMVTNILSGLNMHATETIVYGYLGLINKE